MELTDLKVACKYNRKTKICTVEQREQSIKYRARGWIFKRIGEKMGVSESRMHGIIVGESPKLLESRRKTSRQYYKNNRAYCIKMSYDNEMWRRKNVPNYYKNMLKRNRELYHIKTK